MENIKQKIMSFKDWLFTLSLKKKLIISTIVLAAVFFIGKSIIGGKQQPQYQTAQVDKGSVISTLSESGNVTAVSQTNITSPTDGIIQEVYVKNGDIVVEGQNLFKVKSTATAEEKASAYASYISSLNSTQTAQQGKQTLQAQLETSRKAVLDAQSAVDTLNYNRNNSISNPSTKQPYTQNEIDSINSGLTSAKESFTATETKYNQVGTSINAASLNQTSAWLAYQATQDSVVTAPIAGIVANFSAKVGSNVSASAGGSTSSTKSTSTTSTTSSTSSTVLVIGDFSNLNIVAQVNEIDVPKIHAGQKVTITLDAFSGKTFVGNVDSVDTIGANSSGVVTYNAYISFISPPPDIQSGMTASAVIQTGRKDDVLKVLTTAIQTSNGTSTVRVLKNGKITPTTVETGTTSDTETEIVSGLSEGDTVVTSISTTGSTKTATQTTSPFGRTGLGGGFGGGGQRRGN